MKNPWVFISLKKVSIFGSQFGIHVLVTQVDFSTKLVRKFLFCFFVFCIHYFWGATALVLRSYS